MAKLVATDLDGTLFYPKHTIRMVSNRTVRAIRRFIDNGNKFAIVSGRSFESCMAVIKRIKRDVIIVGCNGAFIMENKKTIYSVSFKEGELLPVMKFMEENFDIRGVLLMNTDKAYKNVDSFKTKKYKFGYLTYMFFQGVYRENFHKSKMSYQELLESGKVHKLLVMFGLNQDARRRAHEASIIMNEKFGDILECAWSGLVVEITPKGCTKAEGLKFVEEYYNINHNDVYVVGDSGNDISMFNAYYENSFCMKKAPLSVSKHAKHIVSRAREVVAYIENEERK